ncbi:tetratricopeptide repeat protein 1-like [Schistocerca piceifrons]|uniref:tetratricopeptide repeat protein 1-like n=1 Tax=Schistocerca piceifrons TaxID=274613 RepID=UPI001F5EA074|nr:tetratricopeptide repeat protein 1-like [Schistocerca piceifrons]
MSKAPCEVSSNVPSNEEIIAELTKDLEQCAVKTNSVNGDTPSTVEHGSVDSILTTPVNCDGAIISSVSDEKAKEGKVTDDAYRSDDDESILHDDYDTVDEEALKIAEATYSDDEKKEKKDEAEKIKLSANDLFKEGKHKEAALKYTLALRTCPLKYEHDRAILYSNRAAAKIKMDLKKEAVEDCSKAIELNPTYVKALLRRAQAQESLEKLDEAFEDYKKILEIEPSHKEAKAAVQRLPYEIEQRNEKLKTEMLSKLKDLGNMILRPFNLSTENFELKKDPNSGGYSVNFKQNPR